MSGKWASSNRRAQLPPDWAARRARCRKRAGGRCEEIIDGQRCPNTGTDAHHPDPDDHDRLVWLCHRCHTVHTQRQAAVGRALVGKRRPIGRPHPGTGVRRLPGGTA